MSRFTNLVVILSLAACEHASSPTNPPTFPEPPEPAPTPVAEIAPAPAPAIAPVKPKVVTKKIGSHTRIELHWDAEHQLTQAAQVVQIADFIR